MHAVTTATSSHVQSASCFQETLLPGSFSLPLVATFLPIYSSAMVPKPLGSWGMVLYSPGAEHSEVSHSLPSAQFWISSCQASTANIASLVKTRGALVFEDKDKSGRVGLIPYPFS